jgi:hypothetical protein
LTSALNSAILLRGRLSPYSASGWPDGCAGAPIGRPQYPALLAGYGPNRPPWNVAGVDYYCGIPTGAILTDWRTLNSPEINVDLGTGLITFNGDYTFNVDFSLGIGAAFRNHAGTAHNITWNNAAANRQPAVWSQ